MLKKIICVLVICMLFISCTSTGPRTNRAVLEHQRNIAEYQATVSYYLGRIDSCSERIESIRARTESLTGEVDRVIELFDQYQRAVEQLLRDYNSLRKALEDQDEMVYNSVSHSFYTNSDEAGRLLSLLERN